MRGGPSSEAFGASACRLEAFSAWSGAGAERDRRPRNDPGTTHLGARHRITSFPAVAACGPDGRAAYGLQPSRANPRGATPEGCYAGLPEAAETLALIGYSKGICDLLEAVVARRISVMVEVKWEPE